ncbi:uncharacterized protein EI90DRAFT_3049404 [Cantharellus anzutake]|uniref:uncharacterized protein n=1 Tax=Cantharellus anzutake TaxID=1750568 RepID=UPI001902D56B|nr:uncharacterized protein EI90DRAFT_3049404 [Cantharellus anzutake]KAF8335077.1 hypothetical protein EI90DRAFT_3049404 [Cantharellus anzutake]
MRMAEPDELTCRDLLPQLPSKEILQQLVEMYMTAGTWIWSYLDEVELKRRVDRFVEEDELDDMTLATFFAICGTGLYYTPWPHNILNAFPEPAMVTGDRFLALSTEVLERRNSDWIHQPTLELLELHLLMAHYYSGAKRGDSGEDIYSLASKMIGIATALGLHRDPEHWCIPPEVASRRRWAWWNVLSFERPPSISNNSFDTQFPMPDFQQPGQLAADDSILPYLCIFRYALLVGQILEDLHCVKPMTFETISAHDQALLDWQNTWPSDLRLDEFGIAYAMSRNASENMVRRGVQCMYLYGLCNLTRLCINRPTIITTAKEAAAAHDRMAGAAAKLVALHARATPDYVNNAVLTVPGHLGHAPYNIFASAMFYTHQLLSNPDQPGAAHFRSNLSEAISTFGKVREMPIADRCFKILVACHPPPETDSEENQQVRRQRIAAVRRVTFPYVKLADVADIEHIYPVTGEGDIAPITAKPEHEQRSSLVH